MLATGPDANGHIEQWQASLLSPVYIIYLNVGSCEKLGRDLVEEPARCYFCSQSDFYRHRELLDLAVLCAARDGAEKVRLSILLKSFSPRYERFGGHTNYTDRERCFCDVGEEEKEGMA